jgi:hypothetical protein
MLLLEASAGTVVDLDSLRGTGIDRGTIGSAEQETRFPQKSINLQVSGVEVLPGSIGPAFLHMLHCDLYRRCHLGVGGFGRA